MLKFNEMKELASICATMRSKGMDIDTSDFDGGGDCYYFKGGWHGLPLTIVYNTINGQFWAYNGFTGKLIGSTKSEELENQEWYMALLNTLYV
jgi:hypothetical protein